MYYILPHYLIKGGPGSSVSIVTGYRLDGPGIESRWGEIFRPSRPALGPTQPPVQWVPGLSRGKVRPGRDANPSPTSSAVGHERVEVYVYSPYGPYGLYNGYRVFPGGKERPGRDANPSPRSSAVGHERVELYIYSPYGPYGLYRASVPVQWVPSLSRE